MKEADRNREENLKRINLYAPEGIPVIKKGDDIGEIICEAAKRQNFLFQDGDIVVIASKIVSKAEGQLIDTRNIEPSPRALSLAKEIGMNPRNLEVILRETKTLLIVRPDLLLTEHHLGFICTKAGVDSSNTIAGPKGEVVALLPEDPDSSAGKIREKIEAITGRKIAVIINDTFGRPDRKGSVGMAIGISGIGAIYTPPTTTDIFGKQRHPQIAQVDEIAAAASLLMGQTNEMRPVVIVRGVEYKPSETAGINDLLHPVEKYVQDAREILEQIASI